MPRRRDHELIELIDPTTGDDLFAPLAAPPRTDTASHGRRRPIVAALAATLAIAGAGVWLQSTESTSAPSPNSAVTTTPSATTPTPTPPRPPGQPPRYIGDAPAGMYLAGSRTLAPPDGDWSYALWVNPVAAKKVGQWIAVQTWPGTLADVALTDGWRHPVGDSEVITAYDPQKGLWTAWSDHDPADGVVLQTIAAGWSEGGLLQLIDSLDVSGGEIALEASELTADLRLQQTGEWLVGDLVGGAGVVDTLVNPDDGTFLNVYVTATDDRGQDLFDGLAGPLFRTYRFLSSTGQMVVVFRTGNWFGRTLTRLVDGEWTVTVTGTVAEVAMVEFVAGLRQLSTASDGYDKVSSRYPPDPQASSWLAAGREGTAEWRVVRSGDQLTWELRFGGLGSVYEQRLAPRRETGEMVTVHSLSGDGFTAVWASAPDDGRALVLLVEEAGGVTTVEPLRPVDSFSGRVLAAHVFSEAQAFTAVVVDDAGEPVAEWPTRGSPEE